jgi:hypothetical protein
MIVFDVFMRQLNCLVINFFVFFAPDILTKFKTDNFDKLRYTKAELEADTHLHSVASKGGACTYMYKEGKRAYQMKQCVVGLRESEGWEDVKFSVRAIQGYTMNLANGR